MIELYKIFAGNYDNNTTEWITGKCIEKQHDTRNHRFALQQSHVHYDMRKFSFSNRIIPIWNSLPDYVVASPTLAVWLSGNALASINVVALRQTRLVLGWVIICGRVNHLGM